MNMSLPTPERVAILSAAFDRVKSKTHWKAPINALVNLGPGPWHDALSDIADAVDFYTATTATIAPVMVEGADHFYFSVKAPGYWDGPAN